MTDDAVLCPRAVPIRSLAAIDPYESYRAASQLGVIHWDDSLRGWVVLGFDECSAILKDDRTFVMAWSLLEGGDVALGRYGIFNLTGANHAQAHRELLDFFNPRKNRELRPAVRRLVAESLDRVAGEQSVDFIHAVAQRVPGLMALAFLGVPQEDAVLPIVHAANTKLQEYMQGFGDDPAVLEALRTAQAGLHDLWRETFAARRTSPTGDLVSRLIAMQATLPDWDDDELVRQALFFFGASFGNTANTIANAVYVLSQDTTLQDDLRAHPDRISTFVDEVLRVWASVQFRIRIATCDTEVGGQLVRAGERVIVLVAAANRDESQFPRPDDVDTERPGSRRHLTFGVGARYCVGATLARVEAEEVVSALLSGDYDLSLSLTGEAPHFGGLNYRVWEPLHLATSRPAAPLPS